jgi:flavin reductase (DIM6/NTAB) family NADH-FMN oxidoreductase RutF
MEPIQKFREGAKRILFGPRSIPQTYYLGLKDPQLDVDVWLCGLDRKLNVTYNHLMACGVPLTICVGLDQKQAEEARIRKNLVLSFREHTGERYILGEIKLCFVSSFCIGHQELCLFHVTAYKNNCLPWPRLWAHYLRYAEFQRKSKDLDVPIATHEARAMIVFYFCPRPITLVTVGDKRIGNIFPMNLMGTIGEDYFAFALNSSRKAAPLVEIKRRVVLSSVPSEQVAAVTAVGANHRKSSIDWSQLPFSTLSPKTIDAPVPAFAVNIKELHVEEVRCLGSHTLFVARTIAKENLTDEPELFVAHGMYRAWQLNSKRVETSS